MKLQVKKLPIGTGDILIAVLNKKDATKLDLYPSDRVLIRNKQKKAVATIDVTECHVPKFRPLKAKIQCVVKEGEIGLFEELQDALNIRDSEEVEISIEPKPDSINYIKKKLKGERLSAKELLAIVRDINSGKLTDVEIAYFVSACYVHELDTKEVVSLTEGMISTGDVLKLPDKIIVDKHCIGGVAANRTSMMVVPILCAAGLTVPKTSSRSITSAAGTSDTVEVLCNVSFPLAKMKKIVQKTGGCLVWGGAVNLAPSDDKIIRVEHPLALDPVGQLLASILAKKKSVSSTHVLIDIPVGRGAKTEDMKSAYRLKRAFEQIGKTIGMKIVVLITDGSQPVGNGIGPSLEARDVIWTLQNSPKGSALLREKALNLSGVLLELTGKAGKGKGYNLAKYYLDSGKAYDKFFEIIVAQGGKKIHAEDIRLAKKTYTVRAQKAGRVSHIDNGISNKIARIAGAPQDKEAGVYLHVHKGTLVQKGDILYTVYSDSDERLKYAKDVCNKKACVEIR